MKSEKSNHINMNKKDLKKLSKSQLINMLLKRSVKKPEIIIVDDYKPVPAPRTYKPVPKPRKSVKQMVQDYEDNKTVPTPRTYKPVPTPRTYKPVPAPITYKPVPAPRTEIEQTNKALKGYTKSYNISIKNNKDPLAHMENTRKAIEYHINKLLNEMIGLKFVETLQVTFKKLSSDEMVVKTAYFNSPNQKSKQ